MRLVRPTCSLCHVAHDDTRPCPPPGPEPRPSGWDALRRRTGSGGKPFPARFPGRCSVCCERIEEGDSVVYDADDDVVHEDCA